MKDNYPRPQKKAYQKPTLKKLGTVSKLTLKTGSRSDFGSGRFQA